MPDWNGDGKRDWHDDYVYNEILNTKKSNQSTNRVNHTRSTASTIIIFIIIAVLWELLNAIASALY